VVSALREALILCILTWTLVHLKKWINSGVNLSPELTPEITPIYVN